MVLIFGIVLVLKFMIFLFLVRGIRLNFILFFDVFLIFFGELFFSGMLRLDDLLEGVLGMFSVRRLLLVLLIMLVVGDLMLGVFFIVLFNVRVLIFWLFFFLLLEFFIL